MLPSPSAGVAVSGAHCFDVFKSVVVPRPDLRLAAGALTVSRNGWKIVGAAACARTMRSAGRLVRPCMRRYCWYRSMAFWIVALTLWFGLIFFALAVSSSRRRYVTGRRSTIAGHVAPYARLSRYHGANTASPARSRLPRRHWVWARSRSDGIFFSLLRAFPTPGGVHRH